MASATRSLLASAPAVVWAARATGLLLPQGLTVLAIYAVFGFDLPLDDLPLGLRIDPRHAVMHVIWGAAGLFVGFVRPRWAVGWLIVFGLYYVTMALLGFFTETHFGLHLGIRENSFHLVIGAASLVYGIASAIARPMIARLAERWGRMIGRYGRSVVNRDSLRVILDAPLPATPVVFVAWHEFNLVTLVLHNLTRARPAFGFIPGGLKGAAVRGWIDGFDIESFTVNGEPQDGLVLRRLKKALAGGSDVIAAVDGPEGPRRVVRPGAAWLARAAGVPIVPVGCAATPSLRVPRWDRHLVPLPGARVVAVIGAAIDHDAALGNLARCLDDLSGRAQAAVLSPDGKAATATGSAPWK